MFASGNLSNLQWTKSSLLLSGLTKHIIILALLLINTQLLAQFNDGAQSLLKKKKILVNSIPFILDTLPVLPESIVIINKEYTAFNFDKATGLIQFNSRFFETDSVWVWYRVVPLDYLNKFRHRSYENIRYHFAYQPEKRKEKEDASFWKSGGIKTEGSIGRTMFIGNNRDVSLNSGMNLRMSGYVGDSIEISAVISDDNLPIQPDGNTQFLRDFDRIFLRIKKGKHQVTLGDVDVAEADFRFMNFKKRIQGIRYDRDSPNQVWDASYTGAVAKGKFYRQVLQPLEGNQGPYRLRGPDNVYYLIILSGSERVYWDGELLQRGQDQDYVIDYNQAEITFTPRRAINKDRRIQVEFEYSERNYINSLIYLKNEWKFTPNFKFSAGYYRSGDVKNSPIDQSLSNMEKQWLSFLGDSIQSAFIPGSYSDTFNTGKVLYYKKDTVYHGIHDSIFVYASRDTERLYSVEFLFLGPGKGNYIQTGTASNNKIFAWVAPGPDNQPSGQWAPVRFVYTPKRIELMSVRSEWTFRKNNYLQADLAYSRNDINLFSSRDKRNDDGLAGKVMWKKTTDAVRLFQSNHQMVLEGVYEKVESDFRSTERIRQVEFYRDWSLPWELASEQEQWISASVKLNGLHGGSFRYEVAQFDRGKDYQGRRHAISQQTTIKGFKTIYQVNYTGLNKKTTKGYFLRPFVSVSKVLDKKNRWLAGGSYFSDQNKLQSRKTDSLVPESFSFYEYKAFIQRRIQETGNAGFSYFSRINYLPAGKTFSTSDKSHNYQFQLDWQEHPLWQFRMNTTYRILHDYRNKKLEKNLSNRTEVSMSTMKRWAEAQLIYEASGGQEQQREFSYVAVPTGQGMYYWMDYNQNGIEELNEFELAVFQDQKKYIRVNTPVSRYVTCLNSMVNFSLQLNPSNVYSTHSNSWIKRLSTASYLQLNNKTLAGNQLLKNPFVFSSNDTAVISTQYFLSNTLFLNRNNRRWAAELTMDQSAQKSLMLYGYEQHKGNRYYGQFRINWSPVWSSSLTYQNSSHWLKTDNALFLNRNYDLRRQYIEPGLTYLYKKKLRTTLSRRMQKGKNQISENERITTTVDVVDLRYQIPSGGSIQFRFSRHQIHIATSEVNYSYSPAGFLLLEGLQPGKNQTWSLEMIQRLAGNLEFNIQYEGRKSDQSKPIHTGRATIRALF